MPGTRHNQCLREQYAAPSCLNRVVDQNTQAAAWTDQLARMRTGKIIPRRVAAPRPPLNAQTVAPDTSSASCGPSTQMREARATQFQGILHRNRTGQSCASAPSRLPGRQSQRAHHQSGSQDPAEVLHTALRVLRSKKKHRRCVQPLRPPTQPVHILSQVGRAAAVTLRGADAWRLMRAVFRSWAPQP